MFNAGQALRNVKDTLALAMEHDATRAAVIVADERCELARALLAAYREGLAGAHVVLYDSASPESVQAAFAALEAGDLAVLVQSTVFRIPNFRIRVELFKRGIKVIEHANLDRMSPDQIEHYIAALAYDPAYYRGIGHPLKARMDAAQSARVESAGEVLRYDCPLEIAKLNIGDFSSLKNFGSQFPIGEVFTEARDLESVSGRAALYAFTDTSMRLNVPDQPITIVVERGRVIDAIRSTAEFDLVLGAIRKDEGEVWLRELGFGMNRALSRERHVSDVAAFERACGVHLSLGARHGSYKKPHLNHREVRYHVDTFVVTDRVWLDEQVVFDHGQWCV
jgi:aminopeptidase